MGGLLPEEVAYGQMASRDSSRWVFFPPTNECYKSIMFHSILFVEAQLWLSTSMCV